MTKIEELSEILKMESELAEALCAILSAKQQAIVRFQGKALADATTREEGLLEPLEKLEAERIVCSAAIRESFLPKEGPKPKAPPKLTEVIGLLGQEDAGRLAPLAERLREAVESILRLNDQNKTLLSHSLHFVKETLRIITEDHTRQLIDQRI
jgi:flagellar biosynthesis/type III secretory pathway chaperone